MIKTIFGDHLGVVSSESDEGSSVFYGIEDNLVAENGSDFGDDKVVVEDDEKVEELDLEKLESVLSLLQTSGIVDGSIESSLEEMEVSLNEEFFIKVLETPYVPKENLISFFKWVLKKLEFLVTTKVVELFVTAICLEDVLGEKQLRSYCSEDIEEAKNLLLKMIEILRFTMVHAKGKSSASNRSGSDDVAL